MELVPSISILTQGPVNRSISPDKIPNSIDKFKLTIWTFAPAGRQTDKLWQTLFFSLLMKPQKQPQNTNQLDLFNLSKRPACQTFLPILYIFNLKSPIIKRAVSFGISFFQPLTKKMMKIHIYFGIE